MRITVPEAELKRRMDEASASMSKTATLQGFRKGRVPTHLLRARYGETIKTQASQNIASEQLGLALEGLRERLLGEPRIEFVAPPEAGGLAFDLTLDLAPPTPSVDFSRLKLRRPKLTVSEGAVEKAMEQLVARTPVYRETDRPAALGHRVKIRTIGHIKGVRSVGESREFEGVLGEKNFFPQIEKELIGGRAGEQKRISFVLGKTATKDRKLNGRRTIFDLKIVAVCAPGKAQLNEDFARYLQFPNLKALREYVRQRLQTQASQLGQSDLRASLRDEISRLYPFPVPDGPTETAARSAKGGKTATKAEKESEEAELRLQFVLRDTIVKQKIKVERVELKGALEENENYLRRQGQTLNGEQKEQLSARLTNILLERKVLHYIYSKAQIADVAPRAADPVGESESLPSESLPSKALPMANKNTNKNKAAEREIKQKTKG